MCPAFHCGKGDIWGPPTPTPWCLGTTVKFRGGVMFLPCGLRDIWVSPRLRHHLGRREINVIMLGEGGVHVFPVEQIER